MKLSADSGAAPRLVKAGSVTVKTYSGRIGRYHTFTVYWRAAGRSHQKTFSHKKEAQKFAREQAESLAAGEYASAVRRLGDAATLNQAVEFFLKNSLRSELQRSVSEVVEESVAMKQSDGLSARYAEDLPGFGLLDPAAKRPLGDAQIAGDFRHGATAAHQCHGVVLKLPIVSATGSAVAVHGCHGVHHSPARQIEETLNFNWGEEVIDIGCDQTKTASRRLAPILPVLVEWIKPQAKPHGPVLNYSLPVCLAEAFATTAMKATKARGEPCRLSSGNRTACAIATPATGSR